MIEIHDPKVEKIVDAFDARLKELSDQYENGEITQHEVECQVLAYMKEKDADLSKLVLRKNSNG
jgi:hypothetical protein